MKAVKAKMFSLMPSSMKNYGDSAVTLRDEVELRMKMNSVSKMIIMVTLIIIPTIVIFNELNNVMIIMVALIIFLIIIFNEQNNDQMSCLI